MVNRRTFLLGSAGVAGALVVGWKLTRPDDRLGTGVPAEVAQGDVPLNGWVMIDADNHVTIVMSKAEMGQGVHTAAAMLLAEELEADWSQVRVVQSSIAGIYGNRENIPNSLPFRPDDQSLKARLSRDVANLASRSFSSMLTGGSTSIGDLWGPMREAGASARLMLCAAAARKWEVAVDQCVAKAGKVLHPASGRSATFGDLVPLAKDLPRPVHPKLKDPATYTLIGKGLKRIEARAKLDGSARFGIDALPDDLLYASVLMCPTLGGRARRCDMSKIPCPQGVVDCFPVEAYNGGTGGVAVIAENPFIAMRALCSVFVDWDHGKAAAISSKDVRAALLKAVEDEDGGHEFYEVGKAAQALKRGKVLHMQYEVPYLAHGALEPVNCTVKVDDKSAQVWVSTQVPQIARDQVARVLDLPKENVHVHEQLIGGAFGRRLEVDFITQAAAIAAKRKPRAVQTIWTRPEDMSHDFYRPACVAKFSGALDADGKLIAWRSASASQSIVEQYLNRMYGLPAAINTILPDATMAEGAFDQPYECENISVRHTRVELPIPVGYWRSVGHSHQAFFVESFLDEMAAAAGKDPIEFRLALLKQPAHRRHVEVLRTLVERAGWRAPHKWKDKAGVECARGMAMHESFGSVVAQVAEVCRDPRFEFRVRRVVCVVDCGLAINPNLVEQQMESGIIFGLSAALQQEITLVNGQVQQYYFSQYPLVDIETCPEIETHIMASTLPPQGVGEAGTPPIAPAVANALFVLTGTRHRTLPLLKAPPTVGRSHDAFCAVHATSCKPAPKR